MRRRARRFLMLFLVGVPLVLLWGELLTRILFPQILDSKMNIFTVDPEVGFIYQPGARAFETGREYKALYQINSVGLRDREYGPKGKNDFRILLVGDSFSASLGMDIENSLSRQLEKALQAAVDIDGIPIKIEVINAAVGGYTPYNYWKAYRRWSPSMKPDAVIVGLSPDDHICNNDDFKYIIKDGKIEAAVKEGYDVGKARDSFLSFRKWFACNSQFYVLFRNFVYSNEIVGVYVNRRLNVEGMQKGELPRFMMPQPVAMKRAWEKTFTYLHLLRDDAAKDGAEMVVVSIPSKVEIDQKEYWRVLKANRLKPEQVDVRQPFQQIWTGCRNENMPVLDTSAALRRRHEQAPCYFVCDGHWNGEGIRTAAVSIAAQWRELGIRPWGKNLERKYTSVF